VMGTSNSCISPDILPDSSASAAVLKALTHSLQYFK